MACLGARGSGRADASAQFIENASQYAGRHPLAFKENGFHASKLDEQLQCYGHKAPILRAFLTHLALSGERPSSELKAKMQELGIVASTSHFQGIMGQLKDGGLVEYDGKTYRVNDSFKIKQG